MRPSDDFDRIVSLVKKRIGFPGDLYKFNPIRRRIEYCMNRIGVHDPGEYLKILKGSDEELKKLSLELTINLSYFFRNPETFDAFEQICLGRILKSKELSIWSAGCAAGEEAYTIAIILDRHKVRRFRILATDIDLGAIKRAKEGVYSQFAVQFVPDEILKTYFKHEEGNYHLDRRIVNMVQFELNDLFQAIHPNTFDAVFLRNVLIYLSRPAQIELLRIVKLNLKKGGYLILGKVETMIGIDPDGLFHPISLRERIYQLL
ncbi:MAG TPA: protein-glutamate O-methyltransferase CheR [bacterium (Candidatus Stahlbacteria)]|nr:protein-glutamate O-methyltransferase CheR [Candidatus Stahlbacteria bacterium]